MPLPRGGGEEEAAQEHSDEEPETRAPHLPAMEGLLAEGHGDAAGEEADGGEDGQVEHVLGVGAVQALAEVEEVGDYKQAEEEDLGGDETQDADAAAPGMGHGGGRDRDHGGRVHSWGPSGSLGCFRSHRGRRLVVTGTTSKL